MFVFVLSVCSGNADKGTLHAYSPKFKYSTISVYGELWDGCELRDRGALIENANKKGGSRKYLFKQPTHSLSGFHTVGIG
jgi:hypothetical protein